MPTQAHRRQRPPVIVERSTRLRWTSWRCERIIDVVTGSRSPFNAATALALMAATGASWAGPINAAAASPPTAELQEFTELLAMELEEQGLPMLPLDVTVEPIAGDEVYAGANMLNDNGEVVESGAITRCQIMYDPQAVTLFEQSDDDPAALRRISAVATHELVHCVEFAVAGTAERVLETPSWIDEGAADWAAFSIVSPDSPAPPDVSEWDEFFQPGLDLFTRDYDAVGFWSAVQRHGAATDVWELLRFAWSLPWENVAADPFVTTALSYDVLQRASADPEFLARWAMSYLRRSEFGTEWDTTGPGLGNEQPPEADTEVVELGPPQVIDGHVRGFAYVDLQFADGVEVVRVTPRASGALHWGLEDGGPDDVFTGAVDGQVARYYCLRDDGCPCPTGMHRAEGRDVLDRQFDAATLTFFGDYEGAEPAPDPRVEVAALSMADAAPDLCTDDIHIEFTVCETWASHEELLAIVPGGTHVTGPQDVGAPEGPWACLWTVVGPPLADPMFFEWTVDVWPFVVARTGQSDEEWNALVGQAEQDKGCTPQPLGPDRVPACVSRSDDSMDVIVRLGADRLLWLRLDTLDYPVPQFHTAGEQLALFFVARLAPATATEEAE